jgi:hypothetical protein
MTLRLPSEAAFLRVGGNDAFEQHNDDFLAFTEQTVNANASHDLSEAFLFAQKVKFRGSLEPLK